MSLTPEQAFKVGFLFKCAEEGLTVPEIRQRIKQAIIDIKNGQNLAGIEKQAIIPQILAGIGALGGGLTSLAGRTLSALPSLASTAGIAAAGLPVAAGAGTGYLSAKLTDVDRKDLLEEAKQDEVVSEYERLADEAKRRALLKRIQAQTGKKIVPLSPSLGA